MESMFKITITTVGGILSWLVGMGFVANSIINFQRIRLYNWNGSELGND